MVVDRVEVENPVGEKAEETVADQGRERVEVVAPDQRLQYPPHLQAHVQSC
jgi:hypothetical protein